MPADADAKTEPATPRRRRDARRKGQIARSTDLSGAVTLFMAMVALKFLGPGMWQSFIAICRAALAPEAPTQMSTVLPLAGAITIDRSELQEVCKTKESRRKIPFARDVLNVLHWQIDRLDVRDPRSGLRQGWLSPTARFGERHAT